ncbi:cell division protein SepF [Gordonia sp. (in: high G+C Gram-positive bacteria)]|uniref:cell division protein SepF n=1 Tax=Gordonia sp. (in: high G+C Gram-positive bacteria) TaxID=84139 RepID=UPI0039E3F3D0
MTTMQKFKAYFGMVPPSDYEDDYLEDEATGALRRVRGADGYDGYYGEGSYRDGGYGDAYGPESYGGESYGPEPYGAEPFGAREMEPRRERVRSSSRFAEDERDYAAVSGGGYVYTGSSRTETRGGARFEPLHRSASATLRAVGATAPVGQDEAGPVFGDGQKITTLRPSSYSEARTIGERFRNGNPVIMDLVDMSNADAKRLVDFAAGLAFALRGSFDKVATKVFLLAPADIDVSPEDRRRIAETGFYSHS